MRKLIGTTLLAAALTAPALAATYPVSGRWGESSGNEKSPIDCSDRRVIAFDGNQRSDTNGGVPSYRNVSVTADGVSSYRIIDTFANALMSNAHTEYTLTKIDDDHIVLDMAGSTLKLQRCE